MIDHVSLYVTDYARSKAFYEKALVPLRYTLHKEFEGKIGGFGAEEPDLWVIEVPESHPEHIAFRADSEATVQAFHAAALAAGGKDNGAPGPRPQYGDDYYGAFILDPDGHNIEAVFYRD